MGAQGVKLLLGSDKAKTLFEKLKRIQPALDELGAAIQEANVSLTTASHMGSALIRLNAGIKECEDLDVKQRLPEAKRLRDRVSRVKEVYITMKAAIVQGQIALNHEEGEEAAITELEDAVNAAKKVQLYKDLPVAVDLLSELSHMNAQHQKVAAAISPRASSDSKSS